MPLKETTQDAHFFLQSSWLKPAFHQKLGAELEILLFGGGPSEVAHWVIPGWHNLVLTLCREVTSSQICCSLYQNEIIRSNLHWRQHTEPSSLCLFC